MKKLFFVVLVLVAVNIVTAAGSLENVVIKNTWNWVEEMKKVAKQFTGTEGVVLNLGDSLTYANQATAWARSVSWNKKGGYTEEDKAILKWSHAYKNNSPLNGWWLAAVDRPHGRSETAASGIRTDQYIKGGFHGLPSLKDILKKYNPQIAIVLLGTNDAHAHRKVEDVVKDMETIIDTILANHTIPVLCTLPPAKPFHNLVKEYNKAYVELAKKKKIPLIDLYGEILKRRPGDSWQGTIIGPDGIHMTHKLRLGPPTEENLSNCGYLLRCWLCVNKIKEIKKKVIDKIKK